MNQKQLKTDLQLILPSSLSQEWDEDLFNRYLEGQKAIDRFLNLDLTPKELTDFLGDVSKVNVHDWLDCVNYNLNH
ncbi:MAG: hypothetical protein QNJ33_12270 [Crocosphaera sp.]|nr:hypothetical protein [Crocosphaera sp.]